MSDLVLLAEAEGVATLVLNRPDKLNAFINLMQPLGLVDVSRTGVAAIARGPEAL